MTSAKANRLIHEKSPYLLQHAYNPVDWYPWGPEAFEKARQENKPILVSIGYSTCHWCHVMEHESYENPEIAELMNRYLVNIKIDREERPDVDKIYMTAISAMTGSGGWPLNAFLTPDLKPFFGGTYFPPAARWGHPGWGDVVKQIGEAWQDPKEREKILAAGNHITSTLQQYVQSAHEPEEGSAGWLEAAFKAYESAYDAAQGGFGRAPKFPMPVNLNFLVRYHARAKSQAALAMTTRTLHAMAAGGIYDQIGGGFARYSTDATWHIPHFEKMLYDNAQLAVNYLEAYQITKDPEFKRIARETLNYVARDMTHPAGGFYSAEDADSLPATDAKHKIEGAYYVWEQPEIMRLLGERDGEIFCFRYGVQENGNAAEDPHGEFKGKNILFVAQTLEFTAKKFGLTGEETSRLLAHGRQVLLSARQRRPRPHLDDKVISAWNGLMMSAFARGYQILGESADLQIAQKTARFIRENLYEPKTRQLFRRWRQGERKIAGIADDYAFMVQGLIDLYEADFDPDWLDWALELTESQNTRFYDADRGGYFMTSADQDPNLLLRVKEDQDNVEPAASSAAVLNLLRLAQYTDRAEYVQKAQKTLRCFGQVLKETPRAMPQMLVALDYALTEPRQIVIAGKPRDADTLAMLRTLYDQFLPVKIVILAEGGAGQRRLAQKLPFLEEIKPLNGRTTGYICIRHACQQPTNDLQQFQRLLTA